MEKTVDRGRQILQAEGYANAGTIEGWAVELEREQVAVPARMTRTEETS
jgi:ribose 5-phosphate isomerase B